MSEPAGDGHGASVPGHTGGVHGTSAVGSMRPVPSSFRSEVDDMMSNEQRDASKQPRGSDDGADVALRPRLLPELVGCTARGLCRKAVR